jgi:hypothetical protein
MRVSKISQYCHRAEHCIFGHNTDNGACLFRCEESQEGSICLARMDIMNKDDRQIDQLLTAVKWVNDK